MEIVAKKDMFMKEKKNIYIYIIKFCFCPLKVYLINQFN